MRTYSNVPSSSLPTMVMILSELEELGHCCCRRCSFFISTIGWDCASSGSLVLEVLSVPAEEEDLQGLGDMIMCVTKDSVSADMVWHTGVGELIWRRRIGVVGAFDLCDWGIVKGKSKEKWSSGLSFWQVLQEVSLWQEGREAWQGWWQVIPWTQFASVYNSPGCHLPQLLPLPLPWSATLLPLKVPLPSSKAWPHLLQPSPSRSVGMAFFFFLFSFSSVSSAVSSLSSETFALMGLLLFLLWVVV